MNLVAKDLMTSPVVSVSETTTVKELVALMSKRAISGVPVVDEGGMLVGVISITDLLAANLGDIDLGHADFHTSPSMDGLTELHDLLAPGEDIEEHQVHQLMSRKSITADETCPLGTISKTLVTNRIHRLVIVREGRPVGIVSVGDILRTLGGFSES